MKRTLLLILFLGMYFQSNAQNKINRYEYWFDQEVSGKTAVTVSAANQFTLNTSLATTGLAYGLHTINLRFRDDSLKWSPVISHFFYKTGSGADTLRKIAQFQYWMDNEIHNIQTSAVSPNSVAYSLNTLLDMKAASTGIHVLNIRFMDHTGFWSAVVTKFFYKLETGGFVGADSVVKAEYWTDQDVANRIDVSFNPQKQIWLQTDLNMNGLSNGLHTLNIRFKDGKGLWSSVVSSFFYKVEANGFVGKDSIVNAEYWIDGEFDQKSTEKLAAQNQWVFIKDLKLNAATEGLHTLTLRFQDGKGIWSAPITRFFYKTTPGIVGENLIDAYRYWMDNADTAIQTVVFNTPTNPYELAMNLDMKKVWKGQHQLHFQFKDTTGKWSVVLTDTFVKKSLPIADFTASKMQFCDSGLVQFTNNSIDYDSVLWDFGDGAFSNEIHAKHLYNKAGKYAVYLKIIDTSAGLNAQYFLKDSIEISNSPYFNLGADTAVCANANYKLETVVAPWYSYLWQDNSTDHFFMPQKSGTYSCMVKNKMGCFYADTVQLVIKPLAIPKFDYTVNKTQVIFADSSKNASGILWKFGDNTSSSQRNPVHNYPDLGTFTAWQIVSNSCNTDSVSHTIIIDQTRVKMLLGEGNMVLYPNPTAGLIYLENLHDWNATEIKIYAANGNDISNNCSYHYFNGKLQVDLTSVADGIYIVQVVQNAHSTSYSIVKQMH